MHPFTQLAVLFAVGFGFAGPDAIAAKQLGHYLRHEITADQQTIQVYDRNSKKIRIQRYSADTVRISLLPADVPFKGNDYIEMVADHRRSGQLSIASHPDHLWLTFHENFHLKIQKNPLRISYFRTVTSPPFLREREGTVWDGQKIFADFFPDNGEHFAGLGHSFYGREQSLDLRGTTQARNYGRNHWDQAPLIVPFYVSNKGYGVFLNSTWKNLFNFNNHGYYSFGIEHNGEQPELDYFIFNGPLISDVLNQYTRLTGRPRLPQLAVFGLGLSDKAHPDTSDEMFWRRKIKEHRDAGFPLDHVVNDNRWRADGGARCRSQFAWDRQRYPDPAVYQIFLTEQGLISTLDFNRCIAKRTAGWKPEFNLPILPDGIDEKDSVPDFTKPEVRTWFWKTILGQGLAPGLKYPGDALWIDEFDELGNVPGSMILGNGRSWQEMRNYWFFLIAKGLVQEGWDRDIGPAKRPYVWVRGMTAGAQRYATLWSGDVESNFSEMKQQVIAMQSAGLSGFPFWGHDAGGFRKIPTGQQCPQGNGHSVPCEEIYRKWGLALGVFSPIWKPHGEGAPGSEHLSSRWPLDRSAISQADFKKYAAMRYSLVPYTYSIAHQAAASGMPMARAMFIDHQYDDQAWKADGQFMWGPALIIAPVTAAAVNNQTTVKIWLPAGKWFDYWDDTEYSGGRSFNYITTAARIPVFVKAGSVIPTVMPTEKSTAFIDWQKPVVHFYAGGNSTFNWIEDDYISEAYTQSKRETVIDFQTNDDSFALSVQSQGSFQGAGEYRSFELVLHGFTEPPCLTVNDTPADYLSVLRPDSGTTHAVFETESRKKIIRIHLPRQHVSAMANITGTGRCDAPEVRRFEAEHLRHNGKTGFKQNASNGSYVGDFNQPGRYIRLQTGDLSAGTYLLKIGYANGGDRSAARTVSINATITRLEFPTHGDWELFNTITTSVELMSGRNNIEILYDQTAQGLVDIDYFELVPYWPGENKDGNTNWIP